MQIPRRQCGHRVSGVPSERRIWRRALVSTVLHLTLTAVARHMLTHCWSFRSLHMQCGVNIVTSARAGANRCCSSHAVRNEILQRRPDLHEVRFHAATSRGCYFGLRTQCCRGKPTTSGATAAGALQSRCITMRCVPNTGAVSAVLPGPSGSLRAHRHTTCLHASTTTATGASKQQCLILRAVPSAAAAQQDLLLEV